ncbi:GerMN domain-containing protein [Psychromicrobium sp. YIM B11713]|uniref:GerMN domain-containing protein n=1 Tax=Psychromicrobium sp. YIM B11713 TaxID=3145233 RepID=UPI00374F186D
MSTQASDLPDTSSSESGAFGSAPLETAQASTKVPVYWIGRVDGKSALYREFLPADPGSDPIQSALQLMTGGKPLDPDYSTPWSKASKIATSISAKNVITVDLSADAFAKQTDNATAQLAIQELVYTATGAAANAGLIDSDQSIQVSLLVDGHTNFAAFDQVKLDRPISRNPSTQAPIWIIDPQQGMVFSGGSITVDGLGPTSSQNLQWSVQRVEPAGGKVNYQSGTTPIKPNAQGGNFEFVLNPPPGNYELLVYRSDPSGNDAMLDLDSKAFTVR